MTDQYKYLEYPEDAFAALQNQIAGKEKVEICRAEGTVWCQVSDPSGLTVSEVINCKFRVPPQSVTTVVYHVHSREGWAILETTNIDIARAAVDRAKDDGTFDVYIVKHKITQEGVRRTTELEIVE